MSAESPRDAVGGGFLGHLVARLQPRASQTAMPTLERRRPGIFEPRGPTPAAALDLMETTVAPSASSLTRATPPPVQSSAHASRGPTIGTPSPAPQTPPVATIARSTAAQALVNAAPRAAHPAAQPPALAMPSKPQPDTTTVAVRSPRRKAARETPASRPAAPASSMPATAPSQASRGPASEPPQTIAVRSAQIVRIEQSRLESRTTVVEREVDKHRHAPAPAVPVQALKTPPRLANSEAPRMPVAHPVRSAAMLAAPAPVAPAPVQVSIGRVEIRGVSGASAHATPRSAASKPQLGLDEYLRQRHGNDR
jgi:hypothetical protein